MTTDEFSKLIKERRVKLNLTQKELADNLHVSNKTISRWETSRGYPDIEMIPILARVLNLSYEELLEGNEYLAKKEKQKRKIYRIVILLLICLCIGIGQAWYNESKGFESKYQNKDLLVSQEMVNRVELVYQEPTKTGSMGTILGIYDFNKSSALLKNLDIDNLKKIPQSQQKNFNYEDFQWLATLHFNYRDDLVQRIHVYLYDHKTYFLFNQNSNYLQINDGDLYYRNDEVKIGLEMFINDLDDYNYNHELKDDSDELMNVDQAKQLALLKQTLVYRGYNCMEAIFVISNQFDHKTYLMIIGKDNDFKELEALANNETLELTLKGKEAMFANNYIHVFELKSLYQKYSLKINGKIDYVSQIEIN